jgi:hypothetical protein
VRNIGSAVAVASKFRNFIDAPENVEIEFGLKFRHYHLSQHRGTVRVKNGLDREVGQIGRGIDLLASRAG